MSVLRRGFRSAAWVLGLATAWPLGAQAQFIDEYFPSGVPGYEQEAGVTVGSRLRRPYEPLGARVGNFVVNSDLLESTGYNSNVAGFSTSPGSWLVRTAPSLTIDSDWTRNRIGAAFTLDDTRYLSAPQQNYTDWTATIGGGYTIGRHEVVVGYSHLSLHQDPTQIGSVLSSTPIPYQVDDFRASYTLGEGRLTFTPRVDVQSFRYGDATLLGVPLSEQNQNRVVTTGGVETRFALSDERSLVFVVQGIDSHYTDQPAGQPTNDSTSVLALGGLDYQASGAWRYRVLVGVERRDFAASQFSSHTAPIAEASVIWTPTGVVTVTGFLARTIEDPAAAGTAGYTYTRARLILDYEFRRNVLVQGRVGFEAAEYLQSGGTQTNASLGLGARWLLNRHMQLALDYSLARQDTSDANLGIPNAEIGTLPRANFTRNLVLVSVRFAL